MRGVDGQKCGASRRDAVIGALNASGLACVAATDVDNIDGTGLNSDDARCACCAISISVPGVSFDRNQVCSLCRDFERDRARVEMWFSEPDALRRLLTSGPAPDLRPVDCLLLYSGGKDSTFALYKLIDMGVRVSTFTLDNGFISGRALDNIARVTSVLNVRHLTLRPEGISATIRDSLDRLATPCVGCFRSLLDHASTHASALGAPFIVTGLSRGQIIQERLEWFHRRNVFDPRVIEETLEHGRQVYHASPGFSGLRPWRPERNAELRHVKVIDFYRYHPATRQEILAFLVDKDEVWSRPDECGFCSTNCLINDPGIALHKARKGWHSYEATNAWEVRLRHNERSTAIEELMAVPPRRANLVLETLGIEALPEGPDLRAAVLCSIASGVTDAQVRAELDDKVAGWEADVRLIYRDAVVSVGGRGDTVRIGQNRRDPVRRPANARWKALAGREATWAIREHALLALPLGLGVTAARVAVLSALSRTPLARLSVTQQDGTVRLEAGRGPTHGHLKAVSFAQAPETHHAGLVRRLLGAPRSPTSGWALEGVLIDRGEAAPWLLLTGAPLLVRWCDWCDVVHDIGRKVAVAAGLPEAIVRPPRFGVDPPEPLVTVAAGEVARLASRSAVWPAVPSVPLLDALKAAGAAWMDAADEIGDPGTRTDLVVRLVGPQEGRLPHSDCAQPLDDPMGRWLPVEPGVHLVVETDGLTARVTRHAAPDDPVFDDLMLRLGLI